jgi:hypothetical protein
MSDSPVDPHDIRAAAETYQELGPDYHDAVVASFLAKVDRELEARVQARLQAPAAPSAQPAVPAVAAVQPPARRRPARRRLRDVVAAAAGAVAVLVGVAVVHHSGAVARSAQPRGGVVGPHHVVPRPPQAPQPPSAP